jgi:hypothetical protein
MSFLTQNTASLCKKIKTLVFKKNANFFADNWGKSLKIVIITSTPVPLRPVLESVSISITVVNEMRLTLSSTQEPASDDLM